MQDLMVKKLTEGSRHVLLQPIYIMPQCTPHVDDQYANSYTHSGG